VERHWAQMKYETLLRSRAKSDEDGSSKYFVFTVSHIETGIQCALFWICVQHHSVSRRMLSQELQ
jgi:hypothetical protein